MKIEIQEFGNTFIRDDFFKVLPCVINKNIPSLMLSGTPTALRYFAL